jgi:hypothetical protein
MESLLKKIGVDEHSQVICLGECADFIPSLQAAGVQVAAAKQTAVSHLFFFVTEKKMLDKNIEKLVTMMQQNTKLYLCFPKGTSGIATDLSRDKGWDSLMQNPHLRWINLIAINNQWSAFAVRLKTEKEKQSIAGLMKETKRRSDYFDAEKKEVYPPDFFLALLKQHQQAEAFFNALAYSHKREYVGYILEAKKIETQMSRAEKSVQRLLDKKKNLTID